MQAPTCRRRGISHPEKLSMRRVRDLILDKPPLILSIPEVHNWRRISSPHANGSYTQNLNSWQVNKEKKSEVASSKLHFLILYDGFKIDCAGKSPFSFMA